MNPKIALNLFCLSLVAAVGLVVTHFACHRGRKELRLYAMGCGRAELTDMSMFSDTGEYDGKPGAIAVSCLLIRHPKGILLWDPGMSDKMAEKPEGVESGGIHMTVSITLASQLKALGLAPADVTYVVFSHFHFDHTGNANLFGSSTWILSQTELNWALSNPTPSGIDPASFSSYKTVRTEMINGDHDVFGDCSVRIPQDAWAHFRGIKC